MKKETGTKASRVLPVPRTREKARQFRDRISKAYAFFTAAFERKCAEMALERLSKANCRIRLQDG